VHVFYTVYSLVDLSFSALKNYNTTHLGAFVFNQSPLHMAAKRIVLMGEHY